ncbi:hypothetical protein GF362_02175 [Candidatus Dojkabacteria bacterium]|nr:hypothetical protein [Candidatus Dojkabacteria bacterium]
MHIDAIKNFLEKLGLSQDEIKIYLTLLIKGNLSVSSISQENKIERTKVYRILDKLISKGFINKIATELGDLFQPAGFEAIKLAVLAREKELESLKAEFSNFKKDIELAQKAEKTIGTDVKFYMGKRGIKQMVWNVTKANTEIKKILNKTAIKFLGKNFWNEFRNANRINGQSARALYSKEYLDSLGELKAEYTDEMVAHSIHQTYKFLPKEVFEIRNYVFLYNDKVAIFNWSQNEIYGIEIKSRDVSTMLNQVYEMLWNIAGEEHTIDKILKQV